MAGLISRYIGNIEAAAGRVAQGVKNYVREAATSGGQVKAINQRQAARDNVAQTQKAGMQSRYYSPKGVGAKPK